MAMVDMLDNDKKNKGGKILCCLIPKIGKCTIDIEVNKDLFTRAFKAFQS